MSRRAILRISCVLSVAALLVAPMTAAFGEEAEIAVSTYAWYWKSQQSQPVTDPTSGADVVTIEAPNPFCPTTPAGGLPEETERCKPGRLPVQVRGSEYKEPEMISAVSFDFALVPLGSTVQSFKASFLEANDEQSAPVNAEGKELQACLIEQFFGDGDARQYKEVPRHTCSETDPIAKRKSVKVKNEEGETEDRFQWTFDLTPFAEQWAEGTLPVAAIMIYPVQPKDQQPQDSNWRVVLSGPSAENGVVTSLKYIPAETPGLDDPITDPVAPPSDTTTSGFDTGSSGFTSGGEVPSTPTDTAAPTTPEEAAAPVAVSGDPTAAPLTPTAGSLPGYVWLAILVGLIGFSLLRQVVVEAATGIRPDGVLAQIRKINTDRRGIAIEEMAGDPTGGSGSPIIQGLKRLGGGASGLVSKLPFVKRKG